MAQTSLDIELRYPAWFEAWVECLSSLPENIKPIMAIWPQQVTFHWRFRGSNVWKEETGYLTRPE